MGEQLQIRRWCNDLSAPDFSVYINNIGHDIHHKHLRQYFMWKCNDNAMSIFWGQGGWAMCHFTSKKARQITLALSGRKHFKGEPITVSLPKSQEEQDEDNCKCDETRKAQENCKAEVHN